MVKFADDAETIMVDDLNTFNLNQSRSKVCALQSKKTKSYMIKNTVIATDGGGSYVQSHSNSTILAENSISVSTILADKVIDDFCIERDQENNNGMSTETFYSNDEDRSAKALNENDQSPNLSLENDSREIEPVNKSDGSNRNWIRELYNLYDNEGNLVESCDEDEDDNYEPHIDDELEEKNDDQVSKKSSRKRKMLVDKCLLESLRPALAVSTGTSQTAQEGQRRGSDVAMVVTPSKNIHRLAVRDLGVVTPTGKREIRNKDYHNRVSLTTHSWAFAKGIDLQSIKLQLEHFEEIREHGVVALNLLRTTNTAQKLMDLFNNTGSSEKYQIHTNSEGFHKYPDTCPFYHCKTVPIAVKENSSDRHQIEEINGNPTPTVEALTSRVNEVEELLRLEKERSAALLKGMSSDHVDVPGSVEENCFKCPFCQVQCNRCDSLKKHIKEFHPETLDDEDTKQVVKDKKSKCKFCKKWLALRTFFRHEKTCKAKKSLASVVTTTSKDKRAGYCHVCKMVKVNLALHMKIHEFDTTDVNTGAKLIDKQAALRLKKVLFNEDTIIQNTEPVCITFLFKEI